MDKTTWLITIMLCILVIKLLAKFFFKGNGFIIKIKNILILTPIMIHEVIHLLGSLMTFGKPLRLVINNNLSGQAEFQGNKLSNMFAIFIGYPGTSLIGYLFANLYITNHIEYIYLTLCFFSIIATYYARSWFTFFWMILFNLLLWFLYDYNDVFLTMLVVGFIVATVIIESLVSAIVIFGLSVQNLKTGGSVHAGDATFLREQTKLPTIMYGFVFMAISIYIFYETMLLLFN